MTPVGMEPQPFSCAYYDEHEVGDDELDKHEGRTPVADPLLQREIDAAFLIVDRPLTRLDAPVFELRDTLGAVKYL